MKRKSIKSLMSEKRVVYIKLTSEKAARAFFALAEYEGFTVSDELSRAGEYRDCFVRLNNDMSITFPEYNSFAGAMKFHYAKTENGKKVVKIDFDKILGT